MRYLFVISLFLLASCQSSQTLAPAVSQQEIAREQQIQRERVAAAKLEEYEKAPKVTKEMEGRFKKLATKVGIAGADLCKDIGNNSCNFVFNLKEDKQLNAYADGKNIFITTAMAKFAANDEELANVMAHEYAHNVMRHVASTQQNAALGAILGAALEYGLQTQGISAGGNLSQAGAQMGVLRYSVGFEKEADYIGLYILERTGYNSEDALDFWRKMSQANEQAIDTGVTHPTNPERFVAMKKTIEEIEAKRRNKQPLIPNFKKKD